MPYINPSTYPSSFGRAVRLYWEERNVSVDNNTSSVYWRLEGYNRAADSTGWYYAGPFTVVVNGQTVADSIYGEGNRIQLRNGTVVAEGTVQNIAHANDGTKSVAISFSCDYISDSSNKASGSATVSLTAIPRASTLVTQDVQFDGAWTFQIERHSSSFTHTVTATVSGTTINATVNESAPSCTFSGADTNSLAAIIPTKNSTSVTLTCKTYSGNQQVGEDYVTTVIATVPTSDVPTIQNASTFFINPWSGYYLQHHTGVQVIANNVRPSVGSYIVSVTFTGNGETKVVETGRTAPQSLETSISAEFEKLLVTGSRRWKMVALDARGRTSAAVYTLYQTITPYNPPTISITAHRCQSDGSADDLGNYAQATVSVSYTPVGSSVYNVSLVRGSVTISNVGWGSNLTTTPATLTSRAFQASNTEAYRLVATITDSVGETASASMRLSTGFVLWDAKDGGTGWAFGGSATLDNAVETKNGWHFVDNGTTLIDELFYKPGDTIVLDSVNGAGFISNASRTCSVEWTLPKSLARITTMTVTACAGAGRTISGNYLGGSATYDYKANATCTAVNHENRFLRLNMVASSAYTNATNNTPVTFTPSSLTITLA